MYILKIEAGNGFEYFTLPKNFNHNLIHAIEYESNARDCEIVLRNKDKYEDNNCSTTGDIGDNLFRHFLPKIKEVPNATNCENPAPFFKIISYYDKQAEEGKRNKDVVFDGRAYLIKVKENGNTTETF